MRPLIFLTLFLPFISLSQLPTHPLDALTSPEYWSIYETLKSSGKLTPASRFAGINLHEPSKSSVLAWHPGQPFPRQALAIVKQGRQTFEALVDIPAHQLISWKEIKGVEPVLISDETDGVTDLLKADPQWQAAMRKRGITDFDTIECDGDSPGYFATPEEKGRRLQRVKCSQTRGFSSGLGHPIEGLITLWDSEEQKVIRIIDTGVVPVPTNANDYDPPAIPSRAVPGPISISQPIRGFQTNGTDITWQNWHFHFRIDPKMGIVVTNVGYLSDGKERSILYEGSLAEIFVPYQDPSEGWYHTTFIDMGEGNTWGSVASVLEPGADCPDNAVYFDSVVATSHGLPERWPRTACLFERESGDFAWRHK